MTNSFWMAYSAAVAGNALLVVVVVVTKEATVSAKVKVSRREGRAFVFASNGEKESLQRVVADSLSTTTSRLGSRAANASKSGTSKLLRKQTTMGFITIC